MPHRYNAMYHYFIDWKLFQDIKQKQGFIPTVIGILSLIVMIISLPFMNEPVPTPSQEQTYASIAPASVPTAAKPATTAPAPILLQKQIHKTPPAPQENINSWSALSIHFIELQTQENSLQDLLKNKFPNNSNSNEPPPPPLIAPPLAPEQRWHNTQEKWAELNALHSALQRKTPTVHAPPAPELSGEKVVQWNELVHVLKELEHSRAELSTLIRTQTQ
jgi:hypothetical protein